MPIRLPPEGFGLSPDPYLENVRGADPEVVSAMRAFYPELAHWSDDALDEALCTYEEDVEGTPTFCPPSSRNDDFIAYLYACQVMPVYRWIGFDPNRLDEAWQLYDAGRAESHALALFDEVPRLQTLFETKEKMLEWLAEIASQRVKKT